MVDFVKVTAKTPNGDTAEYMFMGDFHLIEEIDRFFQFMINCCDDCADRFNAPDNWDALAWHEQTMAKWEAMDESTNQLLNQLVNKYI